MASRDPFKIVLGGRELSIRPLTLRQLQEIEGILLGAGHKSNLEVGVPILAAALKRDHTEVADSLADMEMTIPQIAVAVRTITTAAGFVEVPMGEAKAA